MFWNRGTKSYLLQSRKANWAIITYRMLSYRYILKDLLPVDPLIASTLSTTVWAATMFF
jgi:hypothetical protein|uniref:Uncharacterized protein n=1 Tax=Picea glauca TaxID=3330 RepID=A0A101LZI2_PICGL|nr:hypothetical protein ABT39_MTgene5146 [Picea glauca]